MNDDAQPALDRLIEDIPVKPAPIDDLLMAGRTARRRRRGRGADVGTHAEGAHHTGRSPGLYTEGALPEVTLVPIAPDAEAPVDVEPAAVGSTAPWTDLAVGPYVVTAATRPCHGNCDYLDGPTDSCRSAVDLTTDVEVRVTVRWGEPCRARPLRQGMPAHDAHRQRRGRVAHGRF